MKLITELYSELCPTSKLEAVNYFSQKMLYVRCMTGFLKTIYNFFINIIDKKVPDKLTIFHLA